MTRRKDKEKKKKKGGKSFPISFLYCKRASRASQTRRLSDRPATTLHKVKIGRGGEREEKGGRRRSQLEHRTAVVLVVCPLSIIVAPTMKQSRVCAARWSQVNRREKKKGGGKKKDELASSPLSHRADPSERRGRKNVRGKKKEKKKSLSHPTLDRTLDLHSGVRSAARRSGQGKRGTGKRREEKKKPAPARLIPHHLSIRVLIAGG